MQFERDSFYEVPQVICTTDNIRVWDARGATNCDCPPMSVVWIVRCLPLSRSKDCRNVSIYYGSVYCDTLDIIQKSEQAEIYETKAWQTYSDADAISHDRGGVRESSANTVRTPPHFLSRRTTAVTKYNPPNNYHD